MSNWYLYMVQTGNGLLYTGISTDPIRRLRQHSGELAGGAKALRGKGLSGDQGSIGLQISKLQLA